MYSYFLFSCEKVSPEINVNQTINHTADYSAIIDVVSNGIQALNQAMVSSTLTMSQKMEAIEAAVNKGTISQEEGYSKIIAAINVCATSLSEKVELLKEALNSQTTSLSEKLSLLEAAVNAGIVSDKENTTFLAESIKTLIESQTTTIEALSDSLNNIISDMNVELIQKLDLVEAAIQAGITSQGESTDLIIAAVNTLKGSMEDKLALVEEAVKDGTTSLETKLGLVEAAIDQLNLDFNTEMGLIQTTLTALSTNTDIQTALDAINDALTNNTTGISTKLTTIASAIQTGLADNKSAIDLVKKAIDSLGTNIATHTEDIISAISNISISSGGTFPEVTLSTLESLVAQKSLGIIPADWVLTNFVLNKSEFDVLKDIPKFNLHLRTLMTDAAIRKAIPNDIFTTQTIEFPEAGYSLCTRFKIVEGPDPDNFGEVISVGLPIDSSNEVEVVLAYSYIDFYFERETYQLNMFSPATVNYDDLESGTQEEQDLYNHLSKWTGIMGYRVKDYYNYLEINQEVNERSYSVPEAEGLNHIVVRIIYVNKDRSEMMEEIHYGFLAHQNSTDDSLREWVDAVDY